MRFGLFLLSLLIGSWSSTQLYAHYVDYLSLLGSHIHHVYAPYMYIIWLYKFYFITPSLFKITLWPIIIIPAITFLLLLITIKKKNKLDTHGTADFANNQEIKKMGVLSGAGVIIGAKDGLFTRKFTYFMRGLDQTISNITESLRKSHDAKEERIDPKYRTDFDVTKHGPLLTRYYVIFLKKIHSKLMPFFRNLKRDFYRDNGDKHLAVIAPTRSGKGVGLIIPTLLGSWQSSCIVNDIKSENWGVTAGYRKKVMGHTVIKFMPTDSTGSTARWNPLDEIEIGTPNEIAQAQNLAAILADYKGTGEVDHWTASATALICACILHLKYAHLADPVHYPTPPSLYTLATFLKGSLKQQDDGNNKEETEDFIEKVEGLVKFSHVPASGIKIPEWNNETHSFEYRLFTIDDLCKIHGLNANMSVLKNTGTHPTVFESFSDIANKAEGERASIVSTANTALKEYLDPILGKNTLVSDFCIDDIMNHTKPVSIYLITPPSDLIRMSPVFRLFFEMMVKHHAKEIGVFKQGRASNKYKHKCLFLMDEFSSLGNLKTFASTLSYIAGYGMKVFLINQGLPQITGIYGKDQQILLNCHLQIVYAPNDDDTAQYFEGQLGDRTITYETSSKTGFFGAKNKSEQRSSRKLMTRDELKRLGDEELILASNFNPLKTDKVKYYESNYFLKRLLDAPIISDVIRQHKKNTPGFNQERAALIKQYREEKYRKRGINVKESIDAISGIAKEGSKT